MTPALLLAGALPERIPPQFQWDRLENFARRR
jgi:hypothetical protein